LVLQSRSMQAKRRVAGAVLINHRKKNLKNQKKQSGRMQ
jgi:hypothetical protein